jgi:paraquat-inducible protein A
MTWALLLAAFLIYVPANLLPIMDISLLGQTSYDSTIFGSVVDLWRDGSRDIAAVVFLACIAAPCTKFVALVFLLLSIQLGWDGARRVRTRIYRVLEVVGYWSMLDVLVVSLVTSLIQFKVLGDMEPRPGIYLFGVSVILTMLAARSLDSRLIWDGGKA